MEAHSANILRKSGRGASREGGGYVRAGAGQVEGWVPVRPARMASRWWGAASFPGTGCGGVSGAGRGSGCAASPGGAAVGWRTEGSGRCVVGAGRVLECRASGVVPRTGGAGSSGSRAGVGPVRAGADRWARRGPAWTLCSGEAGMEPLPFPNGAGRIPVRSPCSGVEPLFRRARHRVGADRWERRGSAWTLCSGGAGMEPPPFPDGPVASPGRKASHLRAQRPPEGARCSVFGLFLSFSAASRRAGTDAVCKSAVSPLGKSEKVVFLFLLYN